VEGQRQIIINLDEPFDGIPDTVSLYLFLNEELELALTKDYAEYAWFINEKLVSSEKAFTVRAVGVPLKSNSLRVEVKTTSGALFSKELALIVRK
jgi:hypothetical protein